MGRTVRLAAMALLLACGCSLASQAAQPVWHSGFEHGFPGTEWLDFDDGTYAPKGTQPADRASAWTIIHRDSGEPVFAGNHAYKGWIADASGDSHRAYPVIHADIPTPLVNTFMVYLEADYARMAPDEWIHLGTWGNHDPVHKTGRWALHTMAVRGRRLEFAHVAPFSGEYIGPAKQADFPLRRWVRLTAYVHYRGTTGYVQVWQDGVAVLRAQVAQLAAHPGTRLRTAHWGMYASGTLRHGVQYNDDIRICTLARPLTDFNREPQCPATVAGRR